jgi:hypothetical protein
MATINTTVSGAWVKVAADVLENVLISARTVEQLEFATTAADAAPDAAIQGHVLRSGDALTRMAIGPGFIWARTINGGTAVLAVSGW